MAGGPEDDSTHLPLRGVVLCCTSITPEIRSQIAAMAIEMGADHKLDLTSDVTHMVIGELQTPKYKYVAKEREDVQCLMVEWIYAVREQFLSGGDVAVEELERRFKVPTFWGLTVCITGFEDPEQRREMEIQITNHGGEYRGDLRKDCTHLVCFSPAGAKYTSAKAWGIGTVSIEWLSMSIQRGMALEEEYFSPTLLPEERGKGAWKRTPLTRVESLKRAGSDGQFGRARKLRRTASARFSTDNVWGDIVNSAPSPALEGNASFAGAPQPDGDAFQPGVVSGGMVPGQSAQKPEPLRRPLQLVQRDAAAITKPTARAGLFQGKRFLIRGFDYRRSKLLEQHLQAQDAEIHRDVDAFRKQADSLPPYSSFTVVPYTSSPEELSSEPEPTPDNFVTELWLEKCLHEKICIPPSGGAIYTPFRHPIVGFEELSICSTGFEGVNLMHLSKVVKLLGANFIESLTASASVLICNDFSLARLKVKHAIEWKVPIVDPEWLWDCIRNTEFRPLNEYLVHASLQEEHSKLNEVRMATTNLHETNQKQKKQLLGRSIDKNMGVPKPPDLVVKDSFAARSDGGDDSESAPPERQVLSEIWRAPESMPVSEPLREVSPNLSRQPSRSPSKPQYRFEDRGGTQQTKEELATALTSLLNKAREQKPSPTRKRRQLLGRARSDVSTRSVGSRADSVDSMNTDGLGTPLETNFRNSPSKPRPPLMPSVELEKPKHDSITAELLLSHEEMEEQERALTEEQTPVMTQVGYDDAEAGIWRERLSRKMMGDAGNEPTSPEIERELENSRRKNVLKDEGKQSISTRTRHNKGA